MVKAGVRAPSIRRLAQTPPLFHATVIDASVILKIHVNRPAGQSFTVLVAIACLLLTLQTAMGVPESEGSREAANLSSLPDWSIQTVSDQVKNATALCIDDEGNIYVTETYRWREGIEDNRDHTYWIMDDLACETVEQRSAYYKKWQPKFDVENYFTRFSDRVIQLRDANDDGVAEELLEFATGFNEDITGPAIGLLYGRGDIYLTCVPNLWRLRDTNRDGRADEREVLQSGFGVKTSLSGHDLHGLVWGPDGKLYFSMGDRGFHCRTRDGRVLKDVNSGAVFRCDPDGSNLELYYHQLRNPQELAFNEYGDLFTVDNNCDQGDSARVCYLLEGGSSGWHLGAQALTTYGAYIDDGDLDQEPHWLGEGLWKLRFEDQPAHILPAVAHLTNGPSGLTFNSGIGFSPPYENHFLICDYKGAPNLCFLYSFKVKRDQAGYRMAEEHIVRSGIPATDVEVGYNGKIYVSDFGGGWTRSDKGNIYALFDAKTQNQPDVHELKRLFKLGFEDRETVELVELLSHRDMRVRLRSQFALVERGRALVQALGSVARDSNQTFARYHAIWALGQLKATAVLQPLLNDSDAEVRAQVARTLGNIGARSAAQAITERLDDEHPRVRTFAAIALAKTGSGEAVQPLLKYLERTNNLDSFERHAAVFALVHLSTPAELAALQSHPAAAVRLAAVLALRRLKAPQIARYLSDSEPQIVIETIRAINDEGIDEAFPTLASAADVLTRTTSSPGATTELIYRRVLNACLRTGDAGSALSLVTIAANDKLPIHYRELALQMLPLFDAPPTIDPTLGIYRPYRTRQTQDIQTKIALPLRNLFENSTGKLAAAAIVAMRHYGLTLTPEELVRRVRDGRQPEEVRALALRQLYEEKRYDQKVLLESLLVDDSPLIRSEAVRGYVEAFPQEADRAIRLLLAKQTDNDFRTAYDLLAETTEPSLLSILDEQLELMLEGELFRTVHLDLYQVAKQHPSEMIQAKASRVEQWLVDSDRTLYDFTREGGNPAAGQLVFQNQGVCMKCHRGRNGGGNAGPSLENIGRLRRKHELLESILEPNAVVVKGYGTVTVFLDDGTTLNGSIVSRDAEQLSLKLATGETRVVKLDTIEEMSEPSSPMPKQAQNLSLEEIRDLLAFLATLGTETPE